MFRRARRAANPVDRRVRSARTRQRSDRPPVTRGIGSSPATARNGCSDTFVHRSVRPVVAASTRWVKVCPSRTSSSRQIRPSGRPTRTVVDMTVLIRLSLVNRESLISRRSRRVSQSRCMGPAASRRRAVRSSSGDNSVRSWFIRPLWGNAAERPRTCPQAQLSDQPKRIAPQWLWTSWSSLRPSV